jgi:Tfp pilus assembly protein PilF
MRKGMFLLVLAFANIHAQQTANTGTLAGIVSAIEVKPELTPAQFHLGLALLRRGDRQEAKQHFQSVIEPDPDYYQAQFELGNILLGEGDNEAATIHFQKASESPRPELRAPALERLRGVKEKRQP